VSQLLIYYDGFARYLVYYSILLVLFSFVRQTPPCGMDAAVTKALAEVLPKAKLLRLQIDMDVDL
jgi:hypothetical protein